MKSRSITKIKREENEKPFFKKEKRRPKEIDGIGGEIHWKVNSFFKWTCEKGIAKSPLTWNLTRRKETPGI